jgi:uncharacterized protein YndB with AHSA1/START domain
MDNIERTIFIDAPVERVWTIVTEPEHMGAWLGGAGATRSGDTLTMAWEEHGEHALRIVREEPPTTFAFRWDANDPGVGDTLVEFTLAAEESGTRVTVVESGWGELRTTPERQAELREGNVGGWKHELDDLERYAQSVTV